MMHATGDESGDVMVIIPSVEVLRMMEVLRMESERCGQFLAVPLSSWDDWHFQETAASAAALAFLAYLAPFLPSDLGDLVKQLLGVRWQLMERVPVEEVSRW